MSFGNRSGFADIHAKFVVQLIQINAFQHGFDSLGPDPGFELVAIGFPGFHVFVIRQQLPFSQRGVLGVQHNIAVKIKHLFHVFKRRIKQIADLAGQAFQKPDV